METWLSLTTRHVNLSENKQLCLLGSSAVTVHEKACHTRDDSMSFLYTTIGGFMACTRGECYPGPSGGCFWTSLLSNANRGP